MQRARDSLAAVALLLAAAAGLGLLGAATAQVQDCGPVSLSPKSYDRTVEEGGAAEILADVTNEGPVGGQVWVNVTPAQGWAVDVEPATFVLNATETKQATLTATPTGASSSSPYEMAVSAELDCSVPGVGAAGSDRAEETISLQVESSGSGGGGSTGSNPVTSGPGMGLLILGSVALLSVVGYPMVRRRRRAAVVARAPQPAKRIEPGRGVTFQVEVENPSDEPATYDLELAGIPADWSGFLAQPALEVGAGGEGAVEVLVRAPGEAAPGEGAQVTVRVARHGGGEETVDLTAHVTPD